jgi:hypothetical protein
MSSPAEFQSVSLGRFARRVLQRKARVIARFEHSFYVANSIGIACAGLRLGDGPLNARLRSIERMPAVGTYVFIDTHGAMTWKPPRPSRNGTPGRTIPRGRARGLFATPRSDTEALRTWIASGANSWPSREIDGLIGMGPGLTPAGDDLVGGALIALRALRRYAVAARLAKWALRRSRGRTNHISRAHLTCAAAGEGGAALHTLVNAMLAGRKDLSPEIADIDAIGHTSGWDAAAGVVLAFEASFRPTRRPRARSQARASRRAKRAGARPA